MGLYTERATTQESFHHLIGFIRATHPEFEPSHEQLSQAEHGIAAGKVADAPTVCSVAFPINVSITPGTRQHFDVMSTPDIAMRPKRFVANVSEYGLVILEQIWLGKVPMLIKGDGGTDGYAFSPVVMGAQLDLPIIDRDTPVRIKGMYTGNVPESDAMPPLLAFMFVGAALLEKIEITWHDPQRIYDCDVLDCESHIALPLTGPGPEGWSMVRFGDEDEDYGESEPHYICPNHQICVAQTHGH